MNGEAMLEHRERAEAVERSRADGGHGDVFDAFRGLFVGVVTGAALWLALVGFVFALLRNARAL